MRRIREELEDKNTELARSNDALQQFTYIASHDLKEPLRTISSMGQILQPRLADKLDEQETQMFQFMTQAAERMTLLIEDLRSYTVVGSDAEQPDVADLDSIVDTLLQDLSARIDDLKVKVKREELGEARIIGPQFQQLLMNLLTNAIKFSAESTPPEVSIGPVASDDEDELGIYVRDNGIGIPTEYRDKIFGIFQRLHGREEFEGTGIGLAICKKIIDRHNGRIEVHDAPGRGTEFRIFLPRDRGLS